jgi:uncharacterized protein (DUF2062 family)
MPSAPAPSIPILPVPFSPVVVAPSYNNAATLAEVVRQIDRLGYPLIVVNDGSTDSTPAVLQKFPSLQVLSHPVNRGKAAALHSGFAAAAEHGFTHALTIDTDGQHDPLEIPKLLELSRRRPAALILGTRDPATPGYPLRGKLGRGLSNALIWLECGVRVADSQCGLRVYPLELIAATPCGAGRYGFETEILTRAAWAGRPILQMPVSCRYFPPAQRVSHFRLIGDSLNGVRLHLRLLLGAAWRCARRRNFAARRSDPAGAAASRGQFAAGLALGVFIACLPIFGVQGIVSFLLARRLNVSRVSAVAGSLMSTPPLGAVLIFASIAAGHLLLHGAWLGAAYWRAVHGSLWTLLKMSFADWAVGGVVLGLILSVLTYAIARAALRLGWTET